MGFPNINIVENVNKEDFTKPVKIGDIELFPDSLETLGDGAFSKCSALTKVKFPENKNFVMLSPKVFMDCVSLDNVTIPDTVVIVNQAAFQNCVSLSQIKLSDTVTGIGGSAFENCASLSSATLGKNISVAGLSMLLQRFDSIDFITDKSAVFFCRAF